MNAILVFLCDFLNTYLFFLLPKCKIIELVFFYQLLLSFLLSSKLFISTILEFC